MTRSPNSGNDQEPSNRRLWLVLLGRTSLVLFVILLAGIAAGAWWARNYIYTELAPIVEQNLEQSLGRPIKVGKVESFSLSSLRFSSLSIPATSTDPDQVSAKAVDVEFSLLQLLVTRKLGLNVTLVQPKVFIQQDKDGSWVRSEVKPGEGKGTIQTELQKLEIQDGDIELLPAPAPTKPKGSVVLDQVGGIARFSDDSQGVAYDVNAELTRGGAVKISGTTELKTLNTNLKVIAQDLQASDVTRLIQLPIALEAGQVNADLGVQIQSNQTTEIALTGTAIANKVTAQIENIPQQFANSTGRLVFEGQTITLDNVSTSFGKVPLLANGTVDTKKGFNLSAQIKSVSAKNILDTFKVTSPVLAAGEVQANIKVQGSLQQPVLSGTASNTKPIQVDRVLFKAVNTDFRLSVSESASQIAVNNLELVPAAGGEIRGSGQATLGGQVKFNVAADGVSGDILARSYGFTPPINVGNVSARAVISGSLGKQPLALNISSVQVKPPAGGQIVGNGQIELASQGRVLFNLKAENLPGDAIAKTNASSSYKLGTVSANARIFGTLGNLQTLAQVQAPGATYPTTGQVAIAQQGKNILLPAAVFNVAGSTIRARGQIVEQRWQAIVNASQLQLNRFKEVPPQFQGVVNNAAFNLSGTTASFQPANIQATGRASLSVAGGTVNVSNANLNAGRWQAAVSAQQLQLSRFPEVPPQFQGVVNNASLNLSGTTASFQPANIQATGRASLSVAGGTVNVSNANLNAGRWQAAVNAQQLQLSRFPEVPPQFQGVVNNAALNLSGTTASFQPANIQATGRASLSVAGGTVNVSNANLNAGRWQAAVNAQQLQLSRFPEVPPQFQGVVNNAALNLSGTTASFQPANIQATGRASLSVAGGTVNVSNANLNAGRWQAVANVSQIQLNRFSPQLRGQLNSNVELAGTTASFQLADIRAAGQISASQGLGPLAQPLTAQFQWNGNQIIVQRATTPGLTANGAIAVQLPDNGTPRIAGFNLNIVAQNFNLNNTGLQVPGDLALAGFLDFNGRVTGTLETPQATGNIQLRNFNVSNLAFDPVLTGNVNFQGGQGGSLQLAGRQDRIALNLSADYKPTSFLVKRGEAVTTGRTEGDNLIVNAQQFPIALIGGFIPVSRLKPLGGQLSGNLVVNLNNYAIAGDVAIAAPRVGRVSADEFRANINYANGAASLNNGLLRIGDSNIALSGSLETGNNPQFQVQANFEQTRIEKVLQAFKIYDFKDLGGFESPTSAGAEALDTTPVSLPNADLKTQLEYFSKIQTSVARLQQQQRRNAPPLPTLAEFSGAISGAINASGSLRTGLNVGFNVQGANWEWGDYSIDEVIARGNFADGVVTLSPLSVGINQGQVAFSGQLGTEQLSGQLRVASLPLSLFDPLIKRYPIDVTGEVNAVANLQGSLQDPTVGGQLSLANATLNEQPVQTGQVNFNYNDARFNFDSTLLLQGTQPVTATGSVPVPLPFVAVQPSNQISVNASVRNEGLALLNLFTNNQVSWIDGQGEVDVNVQGTLNQPIINGNATVNNATLRAQALSEPLTNVTGTVLFNRNTINVQGIQGNYNQGLVTASGILPILTAGQNISNPLTVDIEKPLDFQVPNLYEGGVSGNAVIRGTALRPRIGGEIQLSDGRVTIGKTANATSNTTNTAEDNTNNLTTAENSINAATTAENNANAATPTETNTNATTRPNLPVEFTDLRLVLGDDVRVTSQSLLDFVPGGAALSQPILSFDAKGDLTVNGTLAEPLPEGVIRLTGGRISLFSTEFTLERGYEHTASFTPSQGLDPTLDVRLLAIVPETSGTSDRTLESPLSAEISDVSANNFGTLRTVRVRATATGPASELSNNLELTSEPRRSRGEIVALLGGSIINNFTQTGDATQGLTNFASTTVLGSLQGTITAIGQAVGFSEFRIYPTPASNETSRSSVLNLSAEGVFNINNNLSVSLSRPFSNNESFRYNLLYRLSDEILVRGSTNLGDDSQLILDYETRF
ncbi:translocation/assembly module TamB domain-containing protein [Nostoc sp. UHCC 0702]|nr:translocation/assembly module TamB domain-containing protein [Nostoc sp. UHCC 0702]